MYLNRYEFVPRRARLTDAWAPAQTGTGARMRDLSCLPWLLKWLNEYETWVEQTMGLPYRRAVLSSFGRRFESPLGLGLEWLRLKEDIETTPTRMGDHLAATPQRLEPWVNRKGVE